MIVMIGMMICCFTLRIVCMHCSMYYIILYGCIIIVVVSSYHHILSYPACLIVILILILIVIIIIIILALHAMLYYMLCYTIYCATILYYSFRPACCLRWSFGKQMLMTLFWRALRALPWVWRSVLYISGFPFFNYIIVKKNIYFIRLYVAVSK